MGKNGNYRKIINLIKNEPLTQGEIYLKLKKKITLQAVKGHLDRGIKNRILVTLGNKVRKTDTKQLLKTKFKRKWATNAHMHYFHTPQSEKFRKRLIRKYSKANIEDINEISRLYQTIEIMTKFQEVQIFDKKIIYARGKAKGKIYSKKELIEKVANFRKRIKSYYENRDKKNKYISFLRFNPLMYWIAFKRVLPKDHPDYDQNKDMIEILTKPLLSKIAELDKIQLIIEDKNSITIFSSGKIKKID